MTSEPYLEGTQSALEAQQAQYRRNIEALYRLIGARKQECMGPNCKETIWWVKTKSGAAAPMTADGLNHFIDCVDREKFRRSKR